MEVGIFYKNVEVIYIGHQDEDLKYFNRDDIFEIGITYEVYETHVNIQKMLFYKIDGNPYVGFWYSSKMFVTKEEFRELQINKIL